MIVPLQTSPNGVIAKFLADLGVPFAAAIGSAITFFIALIIVYLLGRIIVLPLVTRMLVARELERHAKAPIQKLTRGVIVFVALAVAFGFAGYGSFLTSLATIAAAATLAIGFALQDVIANFVAGVSPTARFGSTIGLNGTATLESSKISVSASLAYVRSTTNC